MSDAKLSKEEKEAVMAMAKKSVGVVPGEKIGRWNYEDRLALVYWVIATLFSQNKK